APQRSPLIPEVPSIKEAGIPELADVDVVSWAGLLAPAKTPPQIISYWSDRINALLGEPAFVQRLATINVEAAPPGKPEQLHDLMQKDLA
ncbi:tripartite tricarboxylate transporter substrate-binding protein, partial [Vibrio parahaemolyticus]